MTRGLPGFTISRMGRKLLFTEIKAARFTEAVLKGGTIEAAAGLVGWKQRTAYDYLKRGRDALESAGLDPREADAKTIDTHPKIPLAERPFARFTAAYDTALAGAELTLLQKVVGHADTDWRAAAWLLERRWLERYGRHRKVGVDAERAAAEAARARAEAEFAEFRLEQLKKGGGGGGRVFLPTDLLVAMHESSPELAAAFADFLAEQGLSIMERASLSEGITDADIAEVSPSAVRH